MVDAVGVTVAIWIMLTAELLFLSGRFYLRIFRHKQRPKPSDYLMVFCFCSILAHTIALTILDAGEIKFLKDHPSFPRQFDAISMPIIGYSDAMRTFYLKVFYSITFTNHLSLFSAKATLLSFFYEVFPARLRPALHTVSISVGLAFLANIVESLFWCFPFRTMWQPSAGYSASAGFCAQQLIPEYNSAQFAAHVCSTAAVVALPMLLLRSVGPGRREVAFAVSILGVGAASVAASAVSFVLLLRMQVYMLDPAAKHASILSVMVDQCVLFSAACLGVLRFRRMKRAKEEEEELELGANSRTGLVIEVERSWSVKVEMVEAWGHGWKDPWIRPDYGSPPVRGV